MPGISVEQVNPANEPLLRAHWEISQEAEPVPLRDFLPAWVVFRAGHSRSNPEREVLLLGAFETVDGVDRLVGAAQMQMWLRDNTHMVDFSVHVAPADRRRGIGAALLAEVERVASAHGRTSLVATVLAPLDSDAPGERFARAHGYELALSEEVKLVDLPSTERAWPGLEQHAAERLAPYQLVSWTGAAPEEYVDELCRLFSAFLQEAPTGELDLQPQTYTPERIRENERRLAETGRTQVVVAGVAPDGTLAGYSNVTVAEARPHLGFIGITLVMPEHRGHRLGLAMKVRLHQRVRELLPACTTIATGNANVNPWMNAVNEQLGYHVVGHALDMQKRLGAP